MERSAESLALFVRRLEEVGGECGFMVIYDVSIQAFYINDCEGRSTRSNPCFGARHDGSCACSVFELGFASFDFVFQHRDHILVVISSCFSCMI